MCTTAHQILGGIMPILLKNGCLVTLRYCELSDTEFVFVFVFIFCSTLCLILGLRTCLKVLCSSSVFLLFYSLLLLFTACWVHTCSSAFKLIHVRLVFWTRLPYVIEGGPIPDTSVWESFIYVTDTSYHLFFPPLCLLWFHPETTLLRVWANARLLLVLLLLFSLDHHLVKVGSNGLTWSFTECSLISEI